VRCSRRSGRPQPVQAPLPSRQTVRIHYHLLIRHNHCKMPNDRGRCLSCRILHARCEIKPGQDVCSRCRTLGRSRCIFEQVRFKSCKTTTIAAQRTDFVYRPSQSWVPTNLKLTFVSETGDGLENIVKTINDESTSSDQLLKSLDNKDTSPSETAELVNATSDSAWADPLHTAIELLNRHDGPPEIYNSPEQIMPATLISPSPTLSLPTTLPTEYSPACSSIPPLGSLDDNSRPHTSCGTHISTSPNQSLTHREVTLIHYFISVISPWVR
jgi:hypothetical protein